MAGKATATQEALDSAMSLRDAMREVSGADDKTPPEPIGTGSEEFIDANLEIPSVHDEDRDEGDDDPDAEDRIINEENDAVKGLLAEQDGKTPEEGEQPPAEAKTGEEAKPGLTDEELVALQNDADFGRKWQSRFETDPAGVVTALLSSLPPNYQELVLKNSGLAVPQADAKAAEEEDDARYEGLTEQEVWVEKNRADLESLKTMKDLPALVNQEFLRRDDVFGNAAIETYRQEHLVDAIAEVLGLAVPKVDQAKLSEALKAGKTLEQAVADQVGKVAKESVARAKQTQAKRPATPSAESGQPPEIKPGDSLAKIMRMHGFIT